MTDLQNLKDATQDIADAMKELADAIVEAWEKSGIKEIFEQMETLAVEVEKIKPKERARLRPEKNTINRQYKHPVMAVRRTARSRLR